MTTRLNSKPGQRVAKKLSNLSGDQLICVRYRYDEKSRNASRPWSRSPKRWSGVPRGQRPLGASLVASKIVWNECDLRRVVKSAGGRWDPVDRVWELRHD